MGGSSSVAMPGDEPSREAKERLARERAAASRLASKEKRRMMKEMPVIPPDPDAPRRSSSRLSGVDPDPEATKRKREVSLHSENIRELGERTCSSARKGLPNILIWTKREARASWIEMEVLERKKKEKRIAPPRTSSGRELDLRSWETLGLGRSTPSSTCGRAFTTTQPYSFYLNLLKSDHVEARHARKRAPLPPQTLRRLVLTSLPSSPLPLLLTHPNRNSNS